MGLYVTSIMGGAALAATISPFVSLTTSWQVALSMWTGLAIIALILWIVVRDKIGYKSIQKNDSRLYIKESFITNKRAWLLGVFFGLELLFYTCVLAWLPPYYIDLGFKDTHAGLMLAFVCAMEVLSGLVLPAIASRSVDRRGVIFAALLAI